ncbi:MAG: CAP domain-containing protein [Treponema sp.]|nr:CAP domain-containing protein [Treponema sp.]
MRKTNFLSVLILTVVFALTGCAGLDFSGLYTGSGGSSGSSSGAGSSSGKSSGSSSSSSGGSSSGGTVKNADVDSEVRACFNLVNEFRTGNEAYYWNKDNRTKTNLVGKLGTLTLDEGLCRAAQIRADEISTNFSHTRPNGSSCFTVFEECSLRYGTRGENIAAGCKAGRDTFIQWKEENEMYEGQGHRRNMLGDFTKIGIAYTYNPSERYKHYWVMVLAK